MEKLPAADQDAIAARLLAEVDDGRRWESRFASTTDDQWDRLVAEVPLVTSPKGARSHSTTSSRPTSLPVTSVVTAGFRVLLGRLPDSVRQQASPAPTLYGGPTRITRAFNSRGSTSAQPVYSARVGLGYRAVGLWEEDSSKMSSVPFPVASTT